MDRPDAAEGGFSVEINKSDRSLRTQKTRILDEIIFPAMADLTYFFGVLLEHPELQILFENDIKDLFGVRRNKPKETNYGFVFSDLLRGILKIGGPRFEERVGTKKGDFPLRLNDLLQEIVGHKISISLPDVFKTEGAQNAVLIDINRCKSWTAILAYGVDPDIDKEVPSRIFNFGIDELL
ncbi:MAG: hypothetical protein WAM14_12120 [Candidatus Nitrosopolaris sp.]